MNVQLKPLIGKLNNTCRAALESAAGLCMTRTHYEVEIAHWFLKLNEVSNTDFAPLLRHFQIDQVSLSRDLTRALDRLKTGNSRTPSISPYVVRLLNGAWLFASIDFSSSSVRSGHLLLALLADDELVRLAHQISAQWRMIAVEDLHKNFIALVEGSEEDKDKFETSQTNRAEVQDFGTPALSRIFISYRRNDSAGWAGRLYDRLGQRFGKANLFMDIDTIEPGLEFVEVIQNSVASCNVLIALIGPRWLDSMDDTGHRRLENPEDYVRLEITTALERNIRVIPTLLQGAVMPRSTDLPDGLKPLARRNALRIDETRFEYDVTQLIGVLEKDLRSTTAAVASEQRPNPPNGIRGPRQH